MLRRNERVLRAKLFGRLCTGIHQLLRADVHSRLRTRVHELLFGQLLELLRPDLVHELLLGRLVPRLLGRSHSYAFVGLAEYLCRVLPNSLRSVVCTERLLVVPGWLRDQLCSGMLKLLELFKLFGLLGFAV